MKRVTQLRWFPRLAGYTAAVGLALSGFAGIAHCDTPKPKSCCEDAGMSGDMDCCSTSLCAPNTTNPAVVKEQVPVLPVRTATVGTLWTRDVATVFIAHPATNALPHAPPTILRI